MPRTDTITASNWKPQPRGSGSLIGSCTLTLPSGMLIKKATLLRQNGREWVGLPGAAMYDRESGAVLRDDRGKVRFDNIIDFATRADRERFRAQAVVAIHRLLEKLGQTA